MPGDQVSFSATLSAAMSTVVSAQNKVAFGSFNTPIASLSNGAPDCTADPSLGRRFPVFVFMPPQCSPTGQSLTDAEPVPCTVLLAAVIALSPTDFDPIPDGSTLYTCRVNISPTAPAGEYPLVISQIVLSDAHGTPVPGATGSNGKIIVLAPPTATPTETPTATPSDTVTPTATASATPSATLTPTPSATPVPCAGDCNGNQQVTVDELLTLVQAALLGLDARACPAGDLSRVSQITVVEILTAVNRAVDTCQSAL
ncbi:MAG TPA: hypothetical protein VMU34_13585 [Mycobacterium sp.]|nr:hypothetical protein [Mycobacterium sp.]